MGLERLFVPTLRVGAIDPLRGLNRMANPHGKSSRFVANRIVDRTHAPFFR
jgi:hypothetical protein